MRVRRILHASDFSPASRPALQLARDLARAFKAELILFHAIEITVPIGTGEGYVPPRVLEEMWAGTRARAERDMKRLARRAKTAGVRLVTLLGEGPTAATIVETARRRRAGMIVIGTHGRTGVKRFLLGSVAERVVRTSSQPVVTVAGG
jgi:nucleotide-binding universal stress UspA family protein